MIYIVIFAPGVGGDGFVNLLEHSTSITPIDRKICWRVDESTTNSVKFYFPKYSTEILFRINNNYVDAVLYPEVEELLSSEKNTVIPAHYLYFHQFDKSVFKKYYDKICLINLYSTDYKRVYTDFCLKNNDKTVTIDHIKFDILKWLGYTEFVTDIDIDKVWENFDYLQMKLKKLNIEISYESYSEYMNISNRTRLAQK